MHSVPPLLPRYSPERQVEDDRKFEKVLSEAEDAPQTFAGRAIGSRRDLRGIPVIGAGGGAVPGSSPVQALLAKASRRPR